MTTLAPADPDKRGARGRGVGVALLVVSSALWSLSGVMVKLCHLPPLAFAFYRSLAAGVATLAVVPLFRGRRPHAGWMAASALIYTGVVTLLIVAMTVSTAASGILLQYTAPVWCALLGWLLQGRRVGNRTALAMTIAGAGIAVMIAGGRRGDWVGPTCGLASGVFFGGLILTLEKLDRASAGRANPAWIVCLNNLGASLVLLPIVYGRGELFAHAGPLAAVAATGVVQLALPYVLFQFALRRVTPVDASLLTLLEPVLNPVWVAVMTSEVPDRGTLVGGVAILIAMVVEATKREAGQTERVGQEPAGPLVEERGN